MAIPIITISGSDIYISNGKSDSVVEIKPVFKFTESEPSIKVYNDQTVVRTYTVEAIKSNPDLKGQYLHSSIRLLPNKAVMIDGIISHELDIVSKVDEEGLRFQPFFLPEREDENIRLRGKGLFDRGLHFHGKITSSNIRTVCICDICLKSFSLKHFHAGFSDSQYFYSSDSKQTLIVKYDEIQDVPVQLQKEINTDVLARVEAQLPLPTKGSGSYKYYNSFRCPHCQAAFIDFENNHSIRPYEYYGYSLLNVDSQIFVS